MNPVELIRKKRDGQPLNSGELEFLITEYVRGKIPDYQVSAFLMAVYFQGMASEETATLTQIMRDSGSVLNFSSIKGFKIDKHSTGGVGDKVSLVLAPLVASAGMIVPMISGRALAHTGGTLDKLESIPGFRTDLNIAHLKTQLQKIGVALVGQTDNLCPADKKIYALRDTTATVSALPLITASILSKKLAEGIDALVLDVKAGNGAIFKEKERAWELANILVQTAEHFDLKTTAIITSMEQPLGNAVGNWLETKEAIDTLKGAGPKDLVEITLCLGAQMLVLGKLAENIARGKQFLQEKLKDGTAYEKFLQIVEMQGGDCSVIENPSAYPSAKYFLEINSEKNGYISHIDCREIGVISMDLGAGRTSVADSVDYTSGIILIRKVSDQVEKGETLAVAYSNKQELLDRHNIRLKNAFHIVDEKVSPQPLIYSVIDAAGEKKWPSRY